MEKLGTRHSNLDHKIYQTLKTMIIERKLLPGAKIFQDKLAHELGVSRTPLVNALKKLEQEKLIAAIPRKGFYVRLFSKQEMVHIFELREVLEGLAARRAAKQISDSQIVTLKNFFKNAPTVNTPETLQHYAEEDRQFHQFLVEVGEKEFISNILETYNIILVSYQVDLLYQNVVRLPQETLPEHLAIIDAISRRDPVRAEELARAHVAKSAQKLILAIEKEKQDALQ